MENAMRTFQCEICCYATSTYLILGGRGVIKRKNIKGIQFSRKGDMVLKTLTFRIVYLSPPLSTLVTQNHPSSHLI
jgi:hypothetical protein